MRIRAARYLRCPPWELEAQPIDYLWQAITCEGAEGEVEEIRMAHATMKHRHRAALKGG